jgi:integrase/recombinase XerD
MLPARLLTGSIPVPLDEHPAFVYLARLAPRSQRTQRGALEAIARLLSAGAVGIEGLPWHEVRYQHAAAIRAQLAARYSVATANRMLAALRGCLQECWRLGLVDAETYRRAVDLAPVRGQAPPHGRALPVGELHALFAVCAADPTWAGRRDAALLAVLVGAGLRRSEAVALDIGDYDPADGSLLVRHGKGNKARRCFLSGGARELLDAWLALCAKEQGFAQPAIGNEKERLRPLFVRIARGDHLSKERLADPSVRLILRRRCAQAGIADAAPHDLRRTYVGELLNAGADLATVQRMVGHANPATTTRYDRRGEATQARAAELLNGLFVGNV